MIEATIVAGIVLVYTLIASVIFGLAERAGWDRDGFDCPEPFIAALIWPVVAVWFVAMPTFAVLARFGRWVARPRTPKIPKAQVHK